jgi:hypothetical protein
MGRGGRRIKSARWEDGERRQADQKRKVGGWGEEAGGSRERKVGGMRTGGAGEHGEKSKDE